LFLFILQEASDAPNKGKGKKSKAPTKSAKVAPKAGKGSAAAAAASSDEGSGTEAEGKKQALTQTVFPLHLNFAWRECVSAMQQILEPLMPAIRQAIPELSKPMDILPASAAAGKATKKGEDAFKPLSGHKVCEGWDEAVNTLR
jgi:hypothetical protein